MLQHYFTTNVTVFYTITTNFFADEIITNIETGVQKSVKKKRGIPFLTTINKVINILFIISDESCEKQLTRGSRYH